MDHISMDLYAKSKEPLQNRCVGAIASTTIFDCTMHSIDHYSKNYRHFNNSSLFVSTLLQLKGTVKNII